MQAGRPHLALMRYWARLMLAGVPVMVIWRSDDPSVALAILICAPDICRISLILVPWRPIMQPISWKKGRRSFLEENPPQPVCVAEPLGKLPEALPWPAHPQHVTGSRGKRHAHPPRAGGREPGCLASAWPRPQEVPTNQDTAAMRPHHPAQRPPWARGHVGPSRPRPRAGGMYV